MRRHGGKLALALLVAVAACAPAQAAVIGKSGGLTYVKGTKAVPESPTVGSNEKELPCPNGMEATGAGGSIAGKPKKAYLDDVVVITPMSVYTTAWHEANEPKAKMTSWGVCSKKVNQLQLYTGILPTSTPGPFTNPVNCQSSEQSVLGGGATTGGTPDEWRLNGTFPYDDSDGDLITDDGWATTSTRTAAGNSSMIGTSVCSDGRDPKYVREQRTSAKTATVVAKCPGKRAVTGGGGLTSGTGFDAHLVETRPWDDKDKNKVPSDGWLVKFANEAGAEQVFRAQAVCL